MNDKEYLEWVNDVIQERKRWLRVSKKDVVFAKAQLDFWNKYLADAKKTVITDENSVKEALQWKKERK